MVGNCEGWYKSEVKRRSGTRTMSRPSPGRGSAGYPAFRSVPEFGPVLHKRLRCRDSDVLLKSDHLFHRASCYGFSYLCCSMPLQRALSLLGSSFIFQF